jgi:glutamine synthetase
VPGFEAPVKLAYSAATVRLRSAFRTWQPEGSPHRNALPGSADEPVPGLLGAADGRSGRRENKIHPGEAADKNLYDLPPEEDAKIPTVCSSLDQALEYLDKDREFLTRGGVFSNSMIDAYIELKMEEVTRFRMTTHPIEFDMYYSL